MRALNVKLPDSLVAKMEELSKMGSHWIILLALQSLKKSPLGFLRVIYKKEENGRIKKNISML